VFPLTLEGEDRVRGAGHVTLSHAEWFTLMLSYPDHLLATNFVRVTESLGMDLTSPLLASIVRVSEALGII